MEQDDTTLQGVLRWLVDFLEANPDVKARWLRFSRTWHLNNNAEWRKNEQSGAGRGGRCL